MPLNEKDEEQWRKQTERNAKARYMADLIREEYLRAKTIFPEFYNHHEAYAVLLEEVDEYWEEVKKKTRIPKMGDDLSLFRDEKKLMQEAIQVGAMALGILVDLIDEGGTE